MARYFSKDITDPSNDFVAASQFSGNRLARSRYVGDLANWQDKVLSRHRRIVASRSMMGIGEFHTTEHDDTDGGVEENDERFLCYSIVNYTPGTVYRLAVHAIPNGRASGVPLGVPEEQGSVASIRATFEWEWEDGEDQSRTYTLTLLPTLDLSNDSYDEPNNCFREIRKFELTSIGPYPRTEANNALWSKPGSCRIILTMVGAGRVIDACVWEEPLLYTLEADDDTNDLVGHAFSGGNPIYSFIEADTATPDGDPRKGMNLLYDVTFNQRKYLGPVLLQYNCSYENLDETEFILDPFFIGPGLVLSGDVGEEVNFATGAAETGSGPGFFLSCAGYARDYVQNNFMRTHDRYAIIPVMMVVSCSAAEDMTTPEGVVRLRSGESYVDVPISPGSESDVVSSTAYGYLRVGLNPEDSNRATLSYHVIQSGGVRIYSVTVFVLDFSRRIILGSISPGLATTSVI